MDDTFEKLNELGALVDNRPEEKKEKDFFLTETVAAAAPVDWKTKHPVDWRRFPDQNQDGSGSCVAQSIKRLATINFWLKKKTLESFSATFIYQQRSNKPAAGMIGIEAFDLWKNGGITLESCVPSQEMNDTSMDWQEIADFDKEVAKPFAIAGHVGLPIKDFETVASTIQQTEKGVMLWFYFTSKEWGKEIPVIIDQNLNLNAPSTIRHSVVGTDFFKLSDGRKVILCEDSAWFGGHKYHLITEEFFNARNWFARYPMNFKYAAEPTTNKPKYKFTKHLTFIPLDGTGNVSDKPLNEAQKADVVALQNILKYEGLFPVNTDSTGYYGAITAKAVLAFQIKHKVSSEQELKDLGGKLVGLKTISKLNELYA